MNIQRLIITTSLSLCAWLTASFLYATPRDLVNAIEDGQIGEAHVANESVLAKRGPHPSDKD